MSSFRFLITRNINKSDPCYFPSYQIFGALDNWKETGYTKSKMLQSKRVFTFLPHFSDRLTLCRLIFPSSLTVVCCLNFFCNLWTGIPLSRHLRALAFSLKLWAPSAQLAVKQWTFGALYFGGLLQSI